MGQEEHRTNITAITNADPCEVTTGAVHGYSSTQLTRLTDLNGGMPTARGQDPLNNKRFEIVVNSTTTFTLRDPITHEDIDSTNYTPYVAGGYCNRIETTFIYEE